MEFAGPQFQLPDGTPMTFKEVVDDSKRLDILKHYTFTTAAGTSAAGTIYIWDERMPSCLPIPQLWRVPHRMIESRIYESEGDHFNVIWGRRLKYNSSLHEDYDGSPLKMFTLENQIAEEIATVVTHGHASWAFRMICDRDCRLQGLAPVVPLIDVNFGNGYTPLVDSESPLNDITVPIAFTPHIKITLISLYWGYRGDINNFIDIATEMFTICAVLDIILFSRTNMTHGDLTPTNVLVIPTPCVFNIVCKGKTLQMSLPFTPSIIDFDQTMYVDNISDKEVITNSLIHLQTLFFLQMEYKKSAYRPTVSNADLDASIRNSSICKAIIACVIAHPDDDCVEKALSCLLERPFDKISFLYDERIRDGRIESVSSRFKETIVFDINTTWEKFSRAAYLETPEGHGLCKYLHETLKTIDFTSSFQGVDFDYTSCATRLAEEKRSRKRERSGKMPVFVRVAKPVSIRYLELNVALLSGDQEKIFKFIRDIKDTDHYRHPTSYYLNSTHLKCIDALEVFYEPERPSGGGGGLDF